MRGSRNAARHRRRPALLRLADGAEAVRGRRGRRPNPRYRDLFPDAPPPGLVPSCAEAGILGVTTGVLGTLAATEAIKLVCGIGEPLVGRLLMVDLLAMRFEEIRYRRPAAAEARRASQAARRRLPATMVCARASAPSARREEGVERDRGDRSKQDAESED